MFSSGVFIVSLALIRACVWVRCNLACLLPFLTFKFICGGGWGGKAQCFILLTEFWQLSCFFRIHKLLLRDKLFFKSLILTRTTTISIVHFYSYSVIPLFYNWKFNITRFYICYCFLLLLSFFHIVYISKWIVLKLSLVLLRKCISYETNDLVTDVFHLPAVDHRIKRRIKELQCQSVKR